MRIVLAAGIYPPDIGGPATYTKEFAAFLRERGHEVRVVTFADEDGSIVIDGIRVFRVNRKQPKLISYFSYLRLLYSQRSFADLFYAQGPLVGGVQSSIVSRLTKKPFALKVVGDYAWEQAAARFNYGGTIDEFQSAKTADLPFPVRIMRMIQYAVAQRASVVIVPSKYLAGIVRQWGRTDARVVFNAVRPPKDVPPRKLNKHAVVSIGRLVPWKGFDTLISVWPRVRERVHDAELFIIGSGPDETKLRHMARGIDGVTCTGQMEKDEVASMLLGASAFVLNSSYEGLSHTIIEAQQYGTPCAVSDSGGNREVVIESRNGLVFPYNDTDAIVESLVTLLTNSKLATELAKNAQEDTKRFMPDAVYLETESLLASLL